MPVAREMVFVGITDGVVVLDQDNRVADINPTIESLFHLSASRVVGQPATQVFQKLPNFLDLLQQGVERAEFQHDTTSGQMVFDVSISSLSESNGRLRGRLVLLHDVTEHPTHGRNPSHSARPGHSVKRRSGLARNAVVMCGGSDSRQPHGVWRHLPAGRTYWRLQSELRHRLVGPVRTVFRFISVKITPGCCREWKRAGVLFPSTTQCIGGSAVHGGRAAGHSPTSDPLRGSGHCLSADGISHYG